MKILFLTPLNTRSRDIESQANEFRKKGHSIFLLTLSSRHELHRNFESYGYQTESIERVSRFSYLAVLQRLLKFILYCHRNGVDMVYAHLEPANFIAVLGQFFVKARVVVCRHHVDFAKLSGFDKDLSYRATYRLARDIIVVSRQAREYVIREEGVPEHRVRQIDLAYDFDLYDPVDEQRVQAIRKEYNSDILLLTIGRLNPHKRPGLSIALMRQLTDLKLDAKLLILGEGELMQNLRSEAISLGVHDRVFFLGFVKDVLNYMSASDFLIHPSVSESSCISVKEAGLAGLPVIVCQGVGDFDEIIVNASNGFLVAKEEFVKSATSIIHDYVLHRELYQGIGSRLRAAILARFDIRKVSPIYEKTFHQHSRVNS